VERPPCVKRAFTSVRLARECSQNLSDRLRVYWCLDCGAYHVTSRDSGKHHEPVIEITKPKARLKRKPVRAPERAAKLASKQRDGWMCRWAGCSVQGRGLVHSAHLIGKKMGGDPLGLVSDKASDYVSLCPYHHRLIDEHFAEVLLTPKGGDGPVEFRMKAKHDGTRG